MLVVGVGCVNLKIEEKTHADKSLLKRIIATTNGGNKRIRRGVVLSHLPVRFAIFTVSAILLASSFLVIQSHESAWGDTLPVVAITTNENTIHRTFIPSAFAIWDLESESENIDIFVQPIFTEDENPQLELQYQRYEDSGERIEFGKELLAQDDFQIDKRLREASLSTELDICFGENWDAARGECTQIDDTIEIDIQWEGTGDLERSSDSQKDVSDDGVIFKMFEHQFGEADALGIIDGENFGESTEANLQSDEVTCITTGQRTCAEDIEEEED
jgi:hypothetical protein